MSAPWLVLGFVGQAMFTLRFLVQWLSSERQGRSVVPLAFWHFSVAGGLLLLIYAIRRGDPVFVVGQLAGLAVYGRNLLLIRRERSSAGGPRAEASSGSSPCAHCSPGSC